MPPHHPSEAPASDGVVLAFDVGTSCTKAGLVRPDGDLAASRTVRHASPAVDGEQDPQVWWDGVGRAARALVGASDRVVGVAFAAQMLGVIPVDDGGSPLRPAILWFDGRADEEAHRVTRRLLGRTTVSRVAGGVPSGKDVVPKLHWLRGHDPDAYRTMTTFLDVTGYLVARSTGRLGADWSAAAATGLLDARRLRWRTGLARAVGVSPATLPPLRAPAEVAGVLLPAAASHLGLRPGLPVAGGAGDTVAAAAGAGPDHHHLHLGTSAWLSRVTTDRRRRYPSGAAALPWLRAGEFLEVAASEAAGVCLEWAAATVSTDPGATPGFDAIEAAAAAVAPGAAGLLYLPWMLGERAPIDDQYARAGFVNLQRHHTREHMARAVYEGVAFNVRWLVDLLVLDTAAPALRVAGGAAVSDLWMQIVADVLGRPVDRCADPAHVGVVGAGRLGAAAFGCGDVIGGGTPTDRRFVPDPGRHRRYTAAYSAFRRVPRALRDVHRVLNR